MSIPILAVAAGIETILLFVWLHRYVRRLPDAQVNSWPVGKVGAR